MTEQTPELPILNTINVIDGTKVTATRMHPLRAGEMARHVKAALFHLHVAEQIAEEADIEVVPGGSDEASPGQLFWNANATLQELDSWAVNTTHASGVSGVYDGTEHWCHEAGRTLPTTGLRI